jgi:hypothetical protein
VPICCHVIAFQRSAHRYIHRCPNAGAQYCTVVCSLSRTAQDRRTNSTSRRRVRFACPSKAPRMSTGGGGGWWWMAGSCRVRFYPRRGHVTAHRGISRQSENGSHTSIPPRGQRARIVSNPVAHGPLSANAYIDRYMPIGAPRHVIGYTASTSVHSALRILEVRRDVRYVLLLLLYSTVYPSATLGEKPALHWMDDARP